MKLTNQFHYSEVPFSALNWNTIQLHLCWELTIRTVTTRIYADTMVTSICVFHKRPTLVRSPEATYSQTRVRLKPKVANSIRDIHRSVSDLKWLSDCHLFYSLCHKVSSWLHLQCLHTFQQTLRGNLKATSDWHWRSMASTLDSIPKLLLHFQSRCFSKSKCVLLS